MNNMNRAMRILCVVLAALFLLGMITPAVLLFS